MIVAVCLNPAIDITYLVPGLRHGASHRAERVLHRAGGKATNVARVLRQLGVVAEVIAPLGGHTGADFLADLRSAGMSAHAVRIANATRRSVTLFDGADATVINEHGPELSATEWAGIADAMSAVVRAGDIVVLAGSVPPGCPPDAYGQLILLARELGARTILDAHGHHLSLALAACPDIAKANSEEVAAALGRELGTLADVLAATAELRARGAAAALISRGPDGLVAATAHGSWTAAVPQRIGGNPTGAGDALTAALAAGMDRGQPWPLILRDAVAVSAAAVVAELAGDIDLATRDRLSAEVIVRRVPGV